MKEVLSYGNDIFVSGLLLTIVLFIAFLLAGKILKKLVRKGIEKKLEKAGKDMVAAYSFTEKVVIFLINLAIVILMFLQVRGFQQVGAAMIGASGILAVVLGLAAQESMSNIIGGFFLAYYKPFNVGDLIFIPEKNLTGIVLEVGLRHTEIKALNNSKITIPNSIMNNTIVENKDKDISAFKNFLFFDISYSSDIDEAIKIIQENCIAHADCVDSRKRYEKEQEKPIVPVLVTGLKDFSVELRATVASKDALGGFQMCCDLRKSIKEDFDKNGIVIPFPTHTIYSEKK